MTNQNEGVNSVSLPHPVFSAEWVRQAECQAAQQMGISLFTLMQRAASAAFICAQQLFPQARHWLVLCGHGNNGGDGYEMARLARQAGIDVTLLAVDCGKPLPEEARAAQQGWCAAGGEIGCVESTWPNDIDLIVDGLLGTGLSHSPREPYQHLIMAINQHAAPVFSLDVPSGLVAESGCVPGVAVQADHTMTFLALKPGLLTGLARDYVGVLHHDALGLEHWFAQQVPLLQRIDASCLAQWLIPRRPCSHKGEHGRLLLVGGNCGFGGAIRMAGEAALRSGAGLVRVLTHKQHVAPLLAACPELMVQELTDETLRAGEAWADVLLIGPGLGQDQWAKDALSLIACSNKPSLWDADALNLLAISPDTRHNRVLTPHPGEAARLLGCSVAEIESDRLLSITKLVQKYGGAVVLKGAGSLIADAQGELAIADVGNPGMATGGMGDVLAGMIAAFIAQKLPLYRAACVGVVAHGAVADLLAARQGTRGLLPTDLLPYIPSVVNPEMKK
jgi:hydroxyethylthiazole kinase-like uncharacterized protein yjeF